MNGFLDTAQVFLIKRSWRTSSLLALLMMLIAPSVLFSQPNPQPTISSVAPNSVPAGSGSTVIVVTGAGFNPGGNDFGCGSKLSFGQTSLTITNVSSQQITATIPASLLATAGKFPIQVTTTGYFGYCSVGTSNPYTFTVLSSLTANCGSLPPGLAGTPY